LDGLSPEEDAIIDRAITETYALKDITPESVILVGYNHHFFLTLNWYLQVWKEQRILCKNFLNIQKVHGQDFMNRPTNIDINRKFIVFSIQSMEDELKPVAMYLDYRLIFGMRLRRERPRSDYLIIDEAWYMMKSEDTASFLFGLAKRGRKYYLGISTITQDVEDFLRSPYGLPIITNSSIQLLMKQSPSSIDMVQQTFHLTEEEKYLLLESGVGEGIFFAGLKHVAIKIIASYTEDQIISSDPSQLLAIKKAKEELKGR
jgi:conjugal transfer ATP-binding protein TraC